MFFERSIEISDLVRQRSKSMSCLKFVTVYTEKKIPSYKKCDRREGGSRNSKNSVTYYSNAAFEKS